MAAKKDSAQPLKEGAWIHDTHFWAAVAIALPFWAVVWRMHPIVPSAEHVLHHVGPFLLVALVYPVMEEIVFRGAVQGFLSQRMRYTLPGPVSPANLATSILYAALHGIVWRSPWVTLVFFPSLLFGYLRQRSDGLGAPIALHVFYNTGFLLVLAR